MPEERERECEKSMKLTCLVEWIWSIIKIGILTYFGGAADEEKFFAEAEVLSGKYVCREGGAPEGFAKEIGYSAETADMLWRRGFDSAQKVRQLLAVDIGAAVEALMSLEGAHRAAELILECRCSDGVCAVYHDYDADGVCAAAIAVETLRAAGVRVVMYSNLRGGDGYGMSPGGVDEIVRRHPEVSLVLTVDNGISAFEGVAHARKLGLSVVVTDHHEPADRLPDADAIVDPKCRSGGTVSAMDAGARDFCGAAVALGVMLKFAELAGIGTEKALAGLDLAAVATVADAMPLVGYNRAIVIEGLKRVNARTRPAFRVLGEASASGGNVDAKTIAYGYAPMLNAPARVTGSPAAALELLLAGDAEAARRAVMKLEVLNEQRKQLTADQTAAALSAVEKGSAAQVLFDESFTEGIAGIVAGRITEQTGCPSAVLARHDGGVLKASCRAPEGFSLVNILSVLAQEGLVTSYGGHMRAAGFSTLEKCLGELRRRFCELAEQTEVPPAQKVCDARLSPDRITLRLARELAGFEPFGEGFPPFLIEVCGYRTGRVRIFGKKREHVRIWDTESGLGAVVWNGAERELLDIICTRRPLHGHVTVDEWGGNAKAEFVVDCERESDDAPVMYCKNGETVRALDCGEDWISVEYRGKRYRRPLAAVGDTLLCSPPQAR